jgi:hypothetical protein
MTQSTIVKIIVLILILGTAGYGLKVVASPKTLDIKPWELNDQMRQKRTSPEQELWEKTVLNKKIEWSGKIYSIQKVLTDKYSVRVRYLGKCMKVDMGGGKFYTTENCNYEYKYKVDVDMDDIFAAEEAVKYKEGQEIKFSGVISGLKIVDPYEVQFEVNLESFRIE